MEELILELLNQLKEVENKAFFHRNFSKSISFPYLELELSGERLERNVEGFYLDVDVYDSNTSFSRLLSLEDNLKAHLKDNRIMTDDLYIRFHYLRSNTINTKDRLLKRRNLQFYCKVDWRNK